MQKYTPEWFNANLTIPDNTWLLTDSSNPGYYSHPKDMSRREIMNQIEVCQSRIGSLQKVISNLSKILQEAD
jgi:hypothetical protein